MSHEHHYVLTLVKSVWFIACVGYCFYIFHNRAGAFETMSIHFVGIHRSIGITLLSKAAWQNDGKL